MTFDERVKRVMEPVIREIYDLYLPGDTPAEVDLRPLMQKLQDLENLMKQLKDDQKQQQPNRPIKDKIREKYEQQRLFEWLKDKADEFLYENSEYLIGNQPEWVKALYFRVMDWGIDQILDAIDSATGGVLDLLVPPPDSTSVPLLEAPQSRIDYGHVVLANFIPEESTKDVNYQLILLRRRLQECCEAMGRRTQAILDALDNMSIGQSSEIRMIQEMRRRCP